MLRRSPLALLALAICCPLALARDYCISSDHGNDSNNGTLVVGNPSTCWASSVPAQNALNSAMLMPGDRVLYCQGDRLFQDGLMLGATTQWLGNAASPVVVGSYNCRDNKDGALQYALPLVTRASILPQSSASPWTAWKNVSWTYPSGRVGWMLAYNLSALNQATGQQFIPTLPNRANAGSSYLNGLWVNGVRYHLARWPNRVNGNVTHGNDTREFMLLDPSRVKTGPIGWSYYVMSNSSQLYYSIGSWCQMKKALYGTNDAAWLARAAKDSYYSGAEHVFRTDDYIIVKASPIGQYRASTADCTEGGAFWTQLVNCTAPCVPLNYSWDDVLVRTIPVPAALCNTSSWLPTRFNFGGGVSYYLNWFPVSGGASDYGGWSMGGIMQNHSDFLDAPQEYIILNDTIFLVPANAYHAQLLLQTWSPSQVALTQAAMANAPANSGFDPAPAVVLFNAGISGAATFGMVGQYSGPLDQYYEVRELDLGYNSGAFYVAHCAAITIHHCYIHDGPTSAAAVFIAGDGVNQTNLDPAHQLHASIYQNRIERQQGGALYVMATTMYIVNNSFVDTAMNWDQWVGYLAVLNAYQHGVFRGNTVLRAGYIGVASGTTVDVSHNVMNHTNAMHLDGGPLTVNGLTDWNLIGSVDTNMLSGIVGGGQVGLSRGVYGMSDQTVLVNNLLVNVSGQCIFGGDAKASIWMENNICVNSGWQIGPFPPSLADAKAANQTYGNNSIFYTGALLGSDVEYWQLPYQPPMPALSQGGRPLVSAPVGYPLFTNSYFCIGVVEPLSTDQTVSAVVTPEGSVALGPSVATTPATMAAMQFSLASGAQSLGASYLTQVASTVAAGQAWALANALNTTFEFGQARCAASLASTVADWVARQSAARAATEAPVTASTVAGTSAGYVAPAWWPWAAAPGQVANLTLLASPGAAAGSGANSSGGAGSWTAEGCWADQAARAIPLQLPGIFSSVAQCQAAAYALGLDTVGLQAGTQCFAGHQSKYAQWGPAAGCGPMGSAWANQVFVWSASGGGAAPPALPPAPKTWVYRGCFVDQANRAIPNQMGWVWPNATACQDAAAAAGYDTLGLQSGAQCFGGVGSSYAKWGPATGCPSPFGGAWQNQVYQWTNVTTAVATE